MRQPLFEDAGVADDLGLRDRGYVPPFNFAGAVEDRPACER